MLLRTLYGEDKCSPAGDRSSSGAACSSDCTIVGQVHQCYTDQARTKREDCGVWTNDNIKTLEYTVDDKVSMQQYIKHSLKTSFVTRCVPVLVKM